MVSGNATIDTGGMDHADDSDPFSAARAADGVLVARFGEETIPMLLRHREVRRAAGDWATFSSDAPMRVPIPSEEQVRSVRQLPIEADPPLHSAVRALLKPIFLRPLRDDYQAELDALVVAAIAAAVAQGTLDIVRDFALPLQSRALALLLGMPQQAADEWIGWGIHVFHDGGDSAANGNRLDAWIRSALRDAEGRCGDDFFGVLCRAEIDGRRLTDDEMAGIANLTFAGGRDTVIHSIARIVAHFAAHRGALDAIGCDARAIAFATEEFVRVVSPLTHIGRVCTRPMQLGGHAVAPGSRVSLCWAAANRDAQVFAEPDQIRLDRSPNPHLGFGSGPHTCLGATQARAILRSLIRHLGSCTRRITIVEERRQFEVQPAYRRWVGYDALIAHVE